MGIRMRRRFGIDRAGRSLIAAGIALVVVPGLLLACQRTEAGDEPAPGVLVIAIDGLRADHVGCYGYDRPTTPTLDRLADEGVIFTQAFANSPALLPSHVSLLTGCEPFVARRYLPAEIETTIERRWRVPAAVPHLAVEFLAHGYDTAAFVDHPQLSPVYGFDPGFEKYVEATGKDVGAAHLTMQLVQWLREVDRDRPWFAYLHLHDLERSWAKPDPVWEAYFTPRPGLEDVPPVGATDSTFFAVPFSRWRGGSRSIGEYEAQYDGHLRRLDESLERLFGSMITTGRLASTTIAVVGSHGIQFGEAGMILAGGRYSMADLHVPLVIRPRAGLEGARVGGSVVDSLASLSDLAPTLLELSALTVPRGTHGISQLPELLGSGPATPRRRFAFASCGIQDGGVRIGERLCYEFLLPGEAEEPLYRRSWLGVSEAPTGNKQIRFYDRVAHPYPPLEAGLREGTPQEFASYSEAAVAWYKDMEFVRTALQPTSLFTEPVAPEKVRELQARGLLVEDL